MDLNYPLRVAIILDTMPKNEPKKKRRKTHVFTASGYSDDCATITGVRDDENDVPGTWYELLADGVPVGRCCMDWDGRRWVFTIKSEDCVLSAGRALEKD